MTFPFPRVAASPHRRVAFLLLLALIASALWAGRAPILRGIANLWIVADAPRKADAIVILGGGVDSRPEVAAQLYHQGLAARILIMQPNPTKIEKLGLIIDDVQATRKYLAMERVPDEAVHLLEPNVTSAFKHQRTERGGIAPLPFLARIGYPDCGSPPSQMGSIRKRAKSIIGKPFFAHAQSALARGGELAGIV